MSNEPEQTPIADESTQGETPAPKLPPVGPSGRERFGDTGEWLKFDE
jgi:hypothetical protein